MKEPLVVCSDFNSSRRTTKLLKARAEPPLTDAVEMDRPVAPDSPPPAPAFIVDDDSASIPWHYIDASGETRGPVSFRVIRAQLRCAMLPPDAMVWREGLDEWCEARVFPAFASCVEDDAGSGRLDATSRPATAGPAPRVPPRATMPNAPATRDARARGFALPRANPRACRALRRRPAADDDDVDGDERRRVLRRCPRVVRGGRGGNPGRPDGHRGDAEAGVARRVWRVDQERARAARLDPREGRARAQGGDTDDGVGAGGVGQTRRGSGRGRGRGGGGAAKMNLSPESLRAEAESLRAALETTRAKLLAKEAEADALRETVRHLRVRIATGGRLTVAGDAGAADGGSDSLDRAELEAAELARARRELEDRTAELVRLKGVLRGELLRRVLEDAETTRTSLGRLDVATDDEIDDRTETFYDVMPDC